MKGWTIFAVVFVSAGLTGCLSDDSRFIKTENPFNLKEVEWATKRGTNTVTGTIDVQGTDGKKYPCDFASVSPDSAYNREIITMNFGNTEGATIPQKDMPIRFVYQNANEDLTVRKTNCGWRGHYTLSSIPDGVWYFTTMAGPRNAGLFMMRRIELRGDQVLEINLP